MNHGDRTVYDWEGQKKGGKRERERGGRSMDERMTGGVLWFWLIDCMMELIDELEVSFLRSGVSDLFRGFQCMESKREGQEKKGGKTFHLCD
jgi:hypothetical protein